MPVLQQTKQYNLVLVYWSKDGDVLQLGRHAWWKVMAAYHWDDLKVTCELTPCTLGSAQGPTLSNDYGRTFTFLQHFLSILISVIVAIYDLHYT